MANKNIDTPSDDQVNDSFEYKRAFYHQSIMLIISGHEKLLSTNINYANYEEQDITGELVRCAQAYRDDDASPEWVSRFAIYEESPENTKRKLGKDRKRVDVVCELTQRGPHPRLKFEAKRLKNKSHPVSIYLGKEGLQEFLNENYAPEATAAGLLGYVQSECCDYWRNQISTALERNKMGLLNAEFEQVNNCYRSLHKRCGSNSEILIFHLLLDFAILS